MVTKTFLILFFIATAFWGKAQIVGYDLSTSTGISHDQLVGGFKNPPSESRLRCYWWWLNSMATKESITRDLEQMKEKGYGGASIVDAGSSSYDVAKKTIPGPVFMSKEWMNLYAHAVKEAQRLGIELSVNVQSGWNPGSPGITPELALKKIVFSETKVEGGRRVKISLPQPETNLMYADIAIQAVKYVEGRRRRDSAIANWSLKSFNKSFGSRGKYPLHKLREEDAGIAIKDVLRAQDIVDLTDKYHDDSLHWEAPEGKWTIIRYGWTCTGARTSTNSDGWSGLSLDHLNPQAFQQFSNEVINPLIGAAKAAGTSLHFLQTDSWEMGSVGWTNDFAREFKKFRNYDITPWLPVLAGYVVQSSDLTNRFLQDYRKTIGECVHNYHYKLFSDLAHANNLGIHPESGGPHSSPVDALRTMAISEFPQGEFWATANTHRIRDDERLVVKQSASVAHTNGKRYVAAEGPTSIGPQWERPPQQLKANIDRIFCSGVNRIVWHTFTSSPKEFGLPGNEYFAGTHLNPNVTWWRQAGDFVAYLNRCSYMLSQGLFVADVLYYYGDDVPNFVFLKDDVDNLEFGHDWDKCSKDVLVNEALVSDGKLILPDGMTYRLLVLPDEKAIDLAVLQKLEILVNEGLVLLAPRPEHTNTLTNYPVDDSLLVSIANRMWGQIDGINVTENSYGKGKVVFGRDVNAVLRSLNVAPDLIFKALRSETSLDYIHRQGDGMEIFFLSNKFGKRGISDWTYRYDPSPPDRYETVECSFRVTGMIPEIWDPITGNVNEITIWHEKNGRTLIPLYFSPEGSQFVVFRKGQISPHVLSITANGETSSLDDQADAEGKPNINVKKEGAKYYALVHAPGKYDVRWSDGKIESFTARNNKLSKLSDRWHIAFDSSMAGPPSLYIDSLRSWTEFGDPKIKYYSGTALYTKSFHFTKKQMKNKRVILDLGNVKDMASIKVNGMETAVKWCAPYTFDITPYLRSGKNTLAVEVVNMWPNRLIGDGQLPENERFTKTNVKKFDAPDAEKYLRVSGLLGPVNIVSQQTIPLRKP